MSDPTSFAQPTPLQSYKGWLELVREIQDQCFAVRFLPSGDNHLGGEIRVASDLFAGKIHIQLDMTVNGHTTTASDCIWTRSSEWAAPGADRLRVFREKLDKLFLDLMKPRLQATADHLIKEMATAELRELLG
jgi:hypothetical protein